LSAVSLQTFPSSYLTLVAVAFNVNGRRLAVASLIPWTVDLAALGSTEAGGECLAILEHIHDLRCGDAQFAPVLVKACAVAAMDLWAAGPPPAYVGVREHDGTCISNRLMPVRTSQNTGIRPTLPQVVMSLIDSHDSNFFGRIGGPTAFALTWLLPAEVIEETGLAEAIVELQRRKLIGPAAGAVDRAAAAAAAVILV
jgi:hypothetical protein